MISIAPNGKPDYSQIPANPGVYLFKDSGNEIIYIGKAKSLRKRVSSYFQKTDHYPKTALMVSKIRQLDWVVVDNEVEALLLENNLIKKHSPKYNIDLKDGKTFAYLKLTDEKFPRILSTRKVVSNGQYFGPYVDGFARMQLLGLVVQLYKIRTCTTLPKKACLNYHIGLCTAPCIGNVTPDQYNLQVKSAAHFLKGDRLGVVKNLEVEMKQASFDLKFEKALEKKRQIDAILNIDGRQKVELVKTYDQDVIAFMQDGQKCLIEMFTIAKGVISGKKEFTFDYHDRIFEEFIARYYSTNKIPGEIVLNKAFAGTKEDLETLSAYLTKFKGTKVVVTVPQRGEKQGLVQMAEKNATINIGADGVLAEFKNMLNLPDIPRIIECFDISNLSYDYIVGAMVRFVDGKPDKKGYRKFKINSVVGKNDDFASMREVVQRRYSRLQKEGAQMPDLVIIDGGRGQLNAALDALKGLELKIPVIALAKREEEIYIPGLSEPKKFDKNSRSMLFVRSVRDSVHKFVLGYNRKRREMRLRGQFGEGGMT